MADSFIWHELMTRDADAAARFYTQVVGWTAADHPGSAQGGPRYLVLSAGDRGVGGVMQLDDAMCEGGARPGWVGYIGVADTDAKGRAVEAAGGRILKQPDDIPGVGRFAMVTDPGGAAFYLMTPLPQDGASPADPHQLGTVGWAELYSSIGDRAAFDFYSAQFGWETSREMDMGPMGTYRIFAADGRDLGGMMNKPPMIPESTWGFYFNVDGIDSAIDRVKNSGGAVTMGPHQVPDGSWIIQGTDPEGASFALVSRQR